MKITDSLKRALGQKSRNHDPAAVREGDARAFRELQTRLAPLFESVFPNRMAPRTVVVVPSLSLSSDVLEKITGIQHYEERLLCLLLLLRLPRTHIVYVTSLPIDPAIIDYYLHLLPGIPSGHARRRLTVLSCHDASPLLPLTRKILDRPRLVERIRQSIPDLSTAHLSCFNVTRLERSLAVRLGIPLYGCDPELCDPGLKSGSRETLKEAEVEVPDGFERLRDEGDIFEAVTILKRRHPDLRRVAIKLEEGTSGEGNALFEFIDPPTPGHGLATWVEAELPARIVFEAKNETWERYVEKFRAMGGVVECWVEGSDKRSPSAQCRVDPLGRVEMISTHDQVLGGPSKQTFEGCTFPADDAYRLEIQEAGLKVARVLRDRGVIGRFGIDFVSVKRGGKWHHFAIEINLRKGGTTHPFLMLQMLTDGQYDLDTGLYLTPNGRPRYYYASDNLKNPIYRGLTPHDLIEIAVDHELHFHGASQQGVVFHLIGALSQYGKLGLVCVADSPAAALRLNEQTVEVLDLEALRQERSREGNE